MIFYPLNLSPGAVLQRLIVSLMRHFDVKTRDYLNSLRANHSLKICFSNKFGEVK